MLVETEPWRLITSAFTHVQIFHIFSNLFMLWMLGPQLEQMLGRLRFAVLYLVSALGGGVAVWLLSSPIGATLGASGAVLGLVGALLVISKAQGQDISWIVSYVGVTALLSFIVPNISWQGHLGGFVTGAAIAWMLPPGHQTPPQKGRPNLAHRMLGPQVSAAFSKVQRALH